MAPSRARLVLVTCVRSMPASGQDLADTASPCRPGCGSTAPRPRRAPNPCRRQTSRTAAAPPPAARHRASCGSRFRQSTRRRAGIWYSATIEPPRDRHPSGAVGWVDLRDARHEQVGRPRQARAALRAVEARKELPKGRRRRTPGAGGNRAGVIDVARASAPPGRVRVDQFRPSQQRRAALQREGRHQAQPHAPAVEGRQPIHRAQQVGVQRRNRAVDHFFDKHLVDHGLVRPA